MEEGGERNDHWEIDTYTRWVNKKSKDREENIRGVFFSLFCIKHFILMFLDARSPDANRVIFLDRINMI